MDPIATETKWVSNSSGIPDENSEIRAQIGEQNFFFANGWRIFLFTRQFSEEASTFRDEKVASRGANMF